jgi:hypothetical protein
VRGRCGRQPIRLSRRDKSGKALEKSCPWNGSWCWAKNGFEDEDDDEYENEGLCEGSETLMFT